MACYQHLSLQERYEIEKGLQQNRSFYQIAKSLGRCKSTISREVTARSFFKKSGCFGAAFHDCSHRFSCTLHALCSDPSCQKKFCRHCAACWRVCSYYEKQVCPKIKQAPYVCNACSSRNTCTLEKSFYSAKQAQKQYEDLLCSSREGANLSLKEAQDMQELLYPLVKKGQSFYAIYQQNKDRLLVDQRTLYRYVEQGVLPLKAMDLPRKVRYKKRRAKKSLKVDKACRIGRTWNDFQAYCQDHPDSSVVQMDSVQGKQGESPVLLTLLFPKSSLFLAFLRERNTAQSVHDVFESLYETLGQEDFQRLFPVLLTDNGSEFSNPLAIEYSAQGDKRTQIFYCNPQASYQKPEIENIHTLVRRILPKGTSFLNRTQAQVQLLQHHINSYIRLDLNHKTPHDVFTALYGPQIAKKLGLVLFSSHEVNLTPSLLQ